MSTSVLLDLEEIARRGTKAQEVYDDCVGRGESHRLATMLALQQAPRVLTDAVFLAGFGTLDKQVKSDEQCNWLVSRAKAQGYDVGPNHVYNPHLARFTGDGEAFIPPSDARGHVQKICEKRGLECNGAVNVKAVQRDPQPQPKSKGKRLASNIVDRIEQRMLTENPDLKHKNRRELRESIVDKHGG